MAYISYKNVGIKAMAAAVPSQVIDNYKYDLDVFPEEDVKKVVDKVGVYERRFADENTCSSDLCSCCTFHAMAFCAYYIT